MPPWMSGGNSRGRDGDGEKKEKENDGPVYSVSHEHYSLPAVRYSNILCTVVIINGLLSVILWLCGECQSSGFFFFFFFRWPISLSRSISSFSYPVSVYFHNPKNSDIDFRIFNIHM